MIYILSLFDPKRAIGFTPLLSIAIIQYFFVSLASSFVNESIDNIGSSLYGSKWYLLNVHLRKDFIRLLLMTRKTKTYTVGPFGFSNLERFRKVCYTIKRIHTRVNLNKMFRHCELFINFVWQSTIS